jgi:outer membrane protein OmpA-like peptidoglycan-associated protein/opacity protein-like surface antigen
MKKTIITLALTLFCLAGIAQTRKLTLKDFKTWSVQGNINSNIGNGDIAKNTPFYSKTSMNLGYGLRLNKFISNNFVVAFDLYNSKLSGDDGKWSYESKINYQPSILLIAQTGNVRYFDELKNFQLYGYLGYGVLNYTSQSQNSLRPELNTSFKGNYQVIPVGVGIKYHIAPDFTANLEYSYNSVNGDKLDGYENSLTNYDNYSRFSIGISYSIGKSFHRELEWHDPRPTPSRIPNRVDTVVIVQKIPTTDSTKLESQNTISNLMNDSIKMDSITFSNAKVTIYYDFNKHKLPILYHYKLQNISLEAINRKNTRLVIESFTDTIGSPENNRIIVERRSNQIMEYLINIGVPKELIDIKLHDENDAIMPTDAENRKSIVYLIK